MRIVRNDKGNASYMPMFSAPGRPDRYYLPCHFSNVHPGRHEALTRRIRTDVRHLALGPYLSAASEPLADFGAYPTATGPAQYARRNRLDATRSKITHYASKFVHGNPSAVLTHRRPPIE